MNDEPGPQIDETTMEKVVDIVSAYVGHNTITASELPGLIASVHGALVSAGTEDPEAAPQEPAVSIRSSIKPDAIACLECGKRLKSLKRHLHTRHDLTPEAYRAKWKLRADYPMVAPNYAAARSQLARKLGLGRKASH